MFFYKTVIYTDIKTKIKIEFSILEDARRFSSLYMETQSL